MDGRQKKTMGRRAARVRVGHFFGQYLAYTCIGLMVMVPVAAHAEAMGTLSVERGGSATAQTAIVTPTAKAPATRPSEAPVASSVLVGPTTAPADTIAPVLPGSGAAGAAGTGGAGSAAGVTASATATGSAADAETNAGTKASPSVASKPENELPLEERPIRASGKTGQGGALGAGGAGYSGSGSTSGFLPGMKSAAQVMGALALVIGLIYVGRAGLRKFAPNVAVGAGKGVMEVLARYPLGKHQSLVMIRIGSQIVVLNQGKETSQSVLVVSEPSEVARLIGQVQGTSPNSIQAGFSNLLNTAQQDLERTPGTEEGATTDDEAPTSRMTDRLAANRGMNVEAGAVEMREDGDMDKELEEMAAARRQLMDLRAQVRSVRDRLV